MSSWSFTVRSSNSCTALTQVHCKRLYSDEKKNSVSSLPARIVSDEWQSVGKNRERKGQRENLLLSVFTTGPINYPMGRLTPPAQGGLCWQCTHCLGTGTARKRSAFKPRAQFKFQYHTSASQAVLQKRTVHFLKWKAFIYLFRCSIPTEATWFLCFLVPKWGHFEMKSPSFQKLHSLKVHKCLGHTQNNMSQ